MKRVVIFRHQLFKLSESFITRQAGALKNFEPIYLGRDRHGVSPAGADSAAMQDMPAWCALWPRVRQVVTRDPRPYVDLLGRRCPALVHAHFGVDGVYGLPLATRLGIPLVTTFHGYDATVSTATLLTSGSPTWINYVMHRADLAARGALFLCVSDHIRQRVLELGFPEARTRVHHVGIDVADFPARARLSDPPTVVHVGRLVEKKGTAVLIRAFRRVLARVPKARLVIIGDGPLRAKLQRSAGDARLGEAVRFTGALPPARATAMIGRSWCLAAPSVTARNGDMEGLPTVLLEAAAAAVPAVATRHSGIPEAVVDGETGFLVAEHDADALSDALAALLTDEALCTTMGAAARKRVKATFDLHRQTLELEALYRSLL